MKKLIFIISIITTTFPLILFAQTPAMDEATLLMKITDYDNVPEQNAILKIMDPDDPKKVIYRDTSDVDGNFSRPLIAKQGQNYIAFIEKFGVTFEFEAADKQIQVPSIGYPVNMTHTFRIKLIEGYQKTYTLDNVFFDTGKSTLRLESYPELEELFFALKGNDNMTVEIAGHTDNVGDDASNMKLSQRRANAVRGYVISKGISASRMIAKGYGETQPVATNETSEGRQKNRRTEVRVISQ
ncbi:MAG: OmpA family protein [Bacteroidia bacterium]|nr:OmpA family protein [Bacteroidia bacterium]